MKGEYIRLTPLQEELLKRICDSDAEIANYLHTGLNNIKQCYIRLRRKFNARNRTELAIKACKTRIIMLDDFKVRED